MILDKEKVEQEYENLLNKDKTIYGQSYEKVTFDPDTGTLTRQRIDPLVIIKAEEKLTK